MTVAAEPAFTRTARAADDRRRCSATSARPTRRRPPAVRRYLAEFLTDPRVVEIPRALWWPILHGIDPARAAGALGAQVRAASGCPKARR